MLVVTGVVLTIILIWHCKCRAERRREGFIKVKERGLGLDNPNYGDVDRGTHSHAPQDYEVPVNFQSQQTPTAKSVNHPSQNLTNRSDVHKSTSGVYSYVTVRHPIPTVSPRRETYDSEFLQSSDLESWELPAVATAESADPGVYGSLSSSYTLLENYDSDT